jgi:hypothetical protein
MLMRELMPCAIVGDVILGRQKKSYFVGFVAIESR